MTRWSAVLGSLGLLAAAVATACSPERQGAPEPEEAPPRPIERVIAEHQERLREVPGRTGILAETKRYSLYDEELIIRDFFQDRRGGFFVDVGCAWPAAANNTYYLEKHLGWRGIGIDALADYGPAWKKERPSSRFFAFLVTDHAGANETFFKSPEPGLSSTNRALATGRRFGEDLEPEEVRVPAITLDALLEREGVAKIDLLAMDIEGHELEALRGFDIERFQPELVVVEGGRGAVARYFERHGYELIERYLPFDEANRYFRRKPAAPTGEEAPPSESEGGRP